MQTAEQTLLDLKYLLREAKQKYVARLHHRIEAFLTLFRLPSGSRLSLRVLRTPTPATKASAARTVVVSARLALSGSRCDGSPLSYHAGLGHSIANCPKLEENQRRTVAGHVSLAFAFSSSLFELELTSLFYRWEDATLEDTRLRSSTCTPDFVRAVRPAAVSRSRLRSPARCFALALVLYS